MSLPADVVAKSRKPRHPACCSHGHEADEESGRQCDEQRRQRHPLAPPQQIRHEEEQKRLEFLTAQRADLTSARLSLQQAIREIDTTARELFATTFVQVRENFRKIFMTLFGGGECDLRLENPESPLEGDIEIHAAPRGKRTSITNELRLVFAAVVLEYASRRRHARAVG